jgi:hypothetical protein
MKHIVKLAMLAHGTKAQDRVIPLLKELDHYFLKVERALDGCGKSETEAE